MPIYEYKCQFCGNYMESLQKISDAPLVDCPQCGKPGLQKMVSAPSFQLKGSGWYVTDFRDNQKEPAKTGHKPEGDKSTGDPKPTDQTAAEKPVEAAKASEEKPKAQTNTTTKKTDE